MIELEKIDKSYDSGSVTTPVLREISFTVERGEYVAIMGPSGSGKSTLMNLVGALDTPTSGEYILNGTDVSKMDDDRLAEIRNQEIGFIFQTFNLLPRYTALENVTLPMVFAGVPDDESHERGMELLDIVGLKDRFQHKPFELSGGQQQRVAVARSLANDPAIILADEPTGNLDLTTGDEIINLLKMLSKEKGVTIISATHDLKMLNVSDRVVWISDGKIEKIEERKELSISLGQIGDK